VTERCFFFGQFLVAIFIYCVPDLFLRGAVALPYLVIDFEMFSPETYSLVAHRVEGSIFFDMRSAYLPCPFCPLEGDTGNLAVMGRDGLFRFVGDASLEMVGLLSPPQAEADDDQHSWL